MSNLLDEIRDLYKSKKYNEIIQLIERVEGDRQTHPAIWVWKARCLQLADDITPYQFSDIEDCLKKAISIDSEYIPAVVELAYFYYGVLDDPERATAMFERAIGLCSSLATEAAIGQAKCIAELQTKQAGIVFLSNVSNKIVIQNEIDELKKSLRSKA